MKVPVVWRRTPSVADLRFFELSRSFSAFAMFTSVKFCHCWGCDVPLAITRTVWGRWDNVVVLLWSAAAELSKFWAETLSLWSWKTWKGVKFQSWWSSMEFSKRKFSPFLNNIEPIYFFESVRQFFLLSKQAVVDMLALFQFLLLNLFQPCHKQHHFWRFLNITDGMGVLDNHVYV